jgi:hypothetical protein
MRSTLKEEQVVALFSHCSHQDQVLDGLYRMALPNWDEVEYVVEGRPHLGERGWHVIYELFQSFDRDHHGEEIFPGLLWISLGFLKDGNLGAWDLDTSEVKVILKPQTTRAI